MRAIASRAKIVCTRVELPNSISGILVARTAENIYVKHYRQMYLSKTCNRERLSRQPTSSLSLSQ